MLIGKQRRGIFFAICFLICICSLNAGSVHAYIADSSNVCVNTFSADGETEPEEPEEPIEPEEPEEPIEPEEPVEPEEPEIPAAPTEPETPPKAEPEGTIGNTESPKTGNLDSGFSAGFIIAFLSAAGLAVITIAEKQKNNKN